MFSKIVAFSLIMVLFAASVSPVSAGTTTRNKSWSKIKDLFR